MTLDVKPRRAEDRAAWFAKYQRTGPYRMLVAAEGDRILGCTYSSRYREHPAFDQTIETSIYLAPDCRARGLGTQLYTKLFTEIAREPLHLAVSGIALPNEASVNLHRKFGFTEVGIFQEYAVKNGKRISSIWMQKKLKA